jgi:hypothetical protein
MKKIIIFTTVLILSNIALAVEDSKVVESTVEQKTEIVKVKKKQGSQESRAKSHVAFQAGLGVITTNFLGTLEGNYIFNDRLVGSLRFGADVILMKKTGEEPKQDGTGTTSTYQPTLGRDEDRTNILMAGVKIFVGNSFYLRPEVYYRTQNEEVRPSLYSSKKERRIYDDVGTSFSIGNEWQFGHFVFGVDWVGLTYKVATVKTNEVNDWLDVDSERTALNILGLHVGASF